MLLAIPVNWRISFKLKEVKQHTPKELVPTFAAAFGKLKLRAAVIDFITAINGDQALWQVKLKKQRIVNFPPRRVKYKQVSYCLDVSSFLASKAEKAKNGHFQTL